MSSMSEATKLHIVPSTWLAPDDTTVEPYERVVGMETADGEAFWVSPFYWKDPKGRYREADIEQRVVHLGAKLETRLATFIDRFMSFCDLEAYNCLLFADWMSGNDQPKPFTEYKEQAAAAVTEGIALDGGLERGEIGYFGGIKDGIAVQPYHAVMGFGSQSEECLQVLSMGGHLGIDSLDNVRRLYIEEYATACDHFGMYALRAAGVSPIEAVGGISAKR